MRKLAIVALAMFGMAAQAEWEADEGGAWQMALGNRAMVGIMFLPDKNCAAVAVLATGAGESAQELESAGLMDIPEGHQYRVDSNEPWRVKQARFGYEREAESVLISTAVSLDFVAEAIEGDSMVVDYYKNQFAFDLTGSKAAISKALNNCFITAYSGVNEERM